MKIANTTKFSEKGHNVPALGVMENSNERAADKRETMHELIPTV